MARMKITEVPRSAIVGAIAGATALMTGALMTAAASADQVFNDDVIITMSLCVGFDCVNGESFGFDTIRLKENNLRIHFQDTSSSGSFPSRDWRLVINDTANGGANYFAIEDSDAGTRPFLVEAGAGSNALYVDDGGRVGLGTSSPVVELHVADGDSPTLRLEQDGSSGFTAQTWDIAGNETNFFIRDVTNASRLPLRIRPSAPTNSIYVDTDGDIGLGTQSPSAALHVTRSNGTGRALIEDTATTGGFQRMLELNSAVGAGMGFRMADGANAIDLVNSNNQFRINIVDGDNQELTLDAAGNLTVDGTVTATGGATLPDYVFEPGYALRSLDELSAFISERGHLPGVPSAEEVRTEDGRYRINITDFQFALLEKIEELTLYTLEQEAAIRQMRAELDGVERQTEGG